jgi:hypothetical protein
MTGEVVKLHVVGQFPDSITDIITTISDSHEKQNTVVNDTIMTTVLDCEAVTLQIFNIMPLVCVLLQLSNSTCEKNMKETL